MPLILETWRYVQHIYEIVNKPRAKIYYSEIHKPNTPTGYVSAYIYMIYNFREQYTNE